jgi:hypothetical protein
MATGLEPWAARRAMSGLGGGFPQRAQGGQSIAKLGRRWGDRGSWRRRVGFWVLPPERFGRRGTFGVAAERRHEEREAEHAACGRSDGGSSAGPSAPLRALPLFVLCVECPGFRPAIWVTGDRHHAGFSEQAQRGQSAEGPPPIRPGPSLAPRRLHLPMLCVECPGFQPAIVATRESHDPAVFGVGVADPSMRLPLHRGCATRPLKMTFIFSLEPS